MKNLLKLAVLAAACGSVCSCNVAPLPGYTGPNNPLSIVSYNAQQQQAIQREAQEANISTDEAAAWNKAGFTNSGGINRWIGVGVDDPDTAVQWIEIDPTNGGSMDYNSPPDWVAPVVQAGLTPEQAQPLLDIIQQRGYLSGTLGMQAVAAWPYYKQGLSAEKAVYYSQNGISLDSVASFDAKKSDYDQQKQDVINNQCGGSVDQQDDISQMSPYAIQGKCFVIQDTSVSQWLNQNSALVDDDNLYLDFPNGQQQTNKIGAAIVQGVGPYSYTATSGAQLTIPEAKVLMYIDQNLEGDAPPQ